MIKFIIRLFSTTDTESDDDISSVSYTSGPDAIVISEEDRTYDASDEDTSSDSEATGHTQSSE